MSSTAEMRLAPLAMDRTGVGLEETYIMKGSNKEKALETYHLILAPSFGCNLQCKHCYLPDHKTHGLSKDDVIRLIDEWSEVVVTERGAMNGIFHLKGGEPLALPYVNDVLDRLEKIRTLRFMMTTNGTLGDRDVVERLGRLNAALDSSAQIIVSIDGSNDEVNAQLRQPGNFDKAVAFVRWLRKAGITVFLNNVVHKGNLNDLEAFVDLALELDVQQINFLSFVPKGQGEAMRFGRPNPLEVFKRIDAIWKQSGKRVRSLLAGSLSDILDAESCGTCTSRECVGGYRGLLYIVPDGTAYSCPNLNYPGLEAGNVHHEGLPRIHGALIDKVYTKVATPESENRYRYTCKGEQGLNPTCDYNGLQFASYIRASNSCQGTEISYCFNRNW
ncbi:MAG: radical SAM protein [Syntrophobacteraceae bacterium]